MDTDLDSEGYYVVNFVTMIFRILVFLGHIFYFANTNS